jgi:hypothetical protein
MLFMRDVLPTASVLLVLFAAGLRRAARTSPGATSAGAFAYYALVGCLFGSVLIGTGLADGLPWQ